MALFVRWLRYFYDYEPSELQPLELQFSYRDQVSLICYRHSWHSICMLMSECELLSNSAL